MTRDEFKEWFRQFRAWFPTIAAWLGKFPRERDEVSQAATNDQPTQREILSGWYETLSRSELIDALAATKRLAMGDEEMPASFDRVAARVRQLAQRLASERRFAAPRPHDVSEPTYRCWRCHDTGFVPIVAPYDLRELLRVWPDGPPDRWDYAEVFRPAGAVIRSCGGYAIDCVCPRGQIRRGPYYDEQEHCLFRGKGGASEPGSYQYVREWIKARQSFREWNPVESFA